MCAVWRWRRERCSWLIGPAKAVCPIIPVGVSVTALDVDRQFIATDRAVLLSDTAESEELAIAEARLAARSRLMQDKTVPKTANGCLRAVKEDAVCTAEGYVYVTMRMSEADMRRADALDNAMRQSIRRSPGPQ
jgi:hypothetical protein